MGTIVFGGDFLKSKIIGLDRSAVVKTVMICLFLIYTLLIIDFTLINDSFGRNISNIFLADKTLVNEYLSQKINLVPFATIKLFIKAYKESNLKPHIVIENILGNLLAFSPSTFFVPRIFKKVNTALKFLLCISCAVLTVEVLQIVFLTGSADIDDFILNVGGAMAVYGVLAIPKIKRTVNKLLFGEYNET